MFDLAKLDTTNLAEKGSALELRHPVTMEKLGATILLAGADSHIYRNAQQKIAERRLAGGKPGTPNLDGMLAEGIDLLATCTLGWENIIVEGESINFTRDEVVELYTRFIWIKEQVDRFIHDRANYLRD